MNEAARTYLLIGSLAFNAFALGVGGTAVVMGGNDVAASERTDLQDGRFQNGADDGRGGDLVTSPERLLPALSPIERRAVVRELGPQVREARRLQARRRDVARAMAEALAAEPFDAEAFREAVEEGNAVVAELRTIGADAMTRIMARMDPATRARIAERFEEAAQGASPADRRRFGRRNGGGL